MNPKGTLYFSNRMSLLRHIVRRQARHFTALAVTQVKSPQQYVQEKQAEEAAHHNFTSGLLDQPHVYDPKMLSDEALNDATKRPVPLNVELLKYKPLQVPKTHNHLVSVLTFKGYNKDTLARAAEFAARAAFYLGIPAGGIQPLKTQKRLYTVIKSPFAQAKLKQNFHRTTFAFQLKAYDALPEIVDLWLAYINKHKLQDVDYSAELIAREPVNMIEQWDKTNQYEMPQGMQNAQDPIAQKVDELLKSDTFKEFMKEEK